MVVLRNGNSGVLCDVIDCRVTAQEIPIDPVLESVTRVMFFITWVTNSAVFAKFGDDAALTNGINIKYKGVNIFDEPIKNLADIMMYAFDGGTTSDGAGTTVFTFRSRLTFRKFTKTGNGLDITSASDLVVDINDNLSGSSNTEIKLIFEGGT